MKRSPEATLRGAAKSLVAMAIIAELSGCAIIPPLKSSGAIKPVDSLQTAKSFAAPAVAWPRDDWWCAYGDPQLNALINEALKSSPDLALATARLPPPAMRVWRQSDR